jgi:hypothetical protein
MYKSYVEDILFMSYIACGLIVTLKDDHQPANTVYYTDIILSSRLKGKFHLMAAAL